MAHVFVIGAAAGAVGTIVGESALLLCVCVSVCEPFLTKKFKKKTFPFATKKKKKRCCCYSQKKKKKPIPDACEHTHMSRGGEAGKGGDGLGDQVARRAR